MSCYPVQSSTSARLCDGLSWEESVASLLDEFRPKAPAEGALRRLLRSLLRDWPADIVQVEHGVLGEALSGAPGLRVVTMHEIAVSMREFLPWRSEGLARSPANEAWPCLLPRKSIQESRN